MWSWQTAAAGGQAEPDLARGLSAVAGVEHQILFGDRPAFAGGDVAAIEARGDLLIEGSIRQHVAGQLFDRELIEGLVAVEGPDDPIAVGPHLAVVVDMDAVRIGIAGRVEPVAAAMLAPLRHGHEAGRRISRTRRAICRSRTLPRSAGSGGRPVRSRLKRRASVRRSASGAGCKPCSSSFGQHEAVDRVANPGLVLHGRQRRPLGGNERPVRLVLGTGGDPIASAVSSARPSASSASPAAASSPRHRPNDPRDQFALIGLARHDGPISMAASRWSSRRSALRLALSGPWHCRQFSARIGRMSRLNWMASPAARAEEAIEEKVIKHRDTETQRGRRRRRIRVANR